MYAAIIDPKAPMPDNYAVRFGHFTFKWNQIESMVEEAIWLIAGTPPHIGRVFTSKQTVRYRIGLIAHYLRSLMCQTKQGLYGKKQIKA